VDLKALSPEEKQILVRSCVYRDLGPVPGLPHVNGEMATTCTLLRRGLEEEENARVAAAAGSV
jgi:hypothetical protein